MSHFLPVQQEVHEGARAQLRELLAWEPRVQRAVPPESFSVHEALWRGRRITRKGEDLTDEWVERIVNGKLFASIILELPGRGAFCAERIIGQGAFAVVVAGKDQQTEEDLVLKILKPDPPPCNRVSEKSFVIEHIISALLQEEEQFVAASLGLFSLKDEIPALLFPAVGISLSNYLHSTKWQLSLERIESIAKDMFRGLALLQRHEIVHCDFTPNNLVIDEKGQVRIIDFGIARLESVVVASSRYITARWWRAPEVVVANFLRDKSEFVPYTTAIDWWAGGTIVADMLLREFCFRSKSSCQLLERMTERLGAPSDEDLGPQSAIEKYSEARQRTLLHLASRPLQPLRRDVIAAQAASLLSEESTDRLERLLCVTERTLRWRPESREAPGKVLEYLGSLKRAEQREERETPPTRERSKRGLSPLAGEVVEVWLEGFEE